MVTFIFFFFFLNKKEICTINCEKKIAEVLQCCLEILRYTTDSFIFEIILDIEKKIILRDVQSSIILNFPSPPR